MCRNLALSWVWAARFRYVNRRNYRRATPEMGRDGYPNLGGGENVWIKGPRWANLSATAENPHAPKDSPR